MRFTIDCSAIPYGTGVSFYTSNLVRHLLPLLQTDSLTLFGYSWRQRSQLTSFYSQLVPNPSLEADFLPLPPSLATFLFHRLNFSYRYFSGPCDLFHAWDWCLPFPGKTPLVATVHDLALFKYPTLAHPQIKAQHQTVISRLKRFQAQIIAVSQTTKNDLIELFDYPADKITVIYEALPEESLLPVTTTINDQLTAQYQLDKPFFLFVGTQEPRKNLPRAIDAWLHFRTAYDFVIVGKKAWQQLPQHPGLKYLGYLPPIKLAALYQQAACLLYPSLYEGFGLPILEAFYHGTPVVTSNLSALPEVAGDAAALVDPTSSEDIIRGLDLVLSQPQTYITQGRLRLSQFSWRQTAEQTLKLYRHLVATN